MFKKTKIAMAASVALGTVILAPVAQAVSVNPDGKGQVLIYPYYNTNNNFQTSFSIRNTKNEYKAVKVRLRESGNSNDVLDFNLYMSPYDVFTFTVAPDGAKSPKLTTGDSTCTFPAIPAGGVSLKGDVYKHTKVVDAREGYLEVIEMGVIDTAINLTSDAKVVKAGKAVVSGLKHDSKGKPKDCSVITQALKDTVWKRGGAVKSVGATTLTYHAATTTPVFTAASPTGFLTPTGGLVGSSILLDLANGAAFVADPTALVNYAANHTTVVSGNTPAGVNGTYLGTTAKSVGNGAQYYLPSDSAYFLLPSLASGNVNTSEVTADNGMATLVSTWSTVKLDWGVTDPNAVLVSGANGPASGINPFPAAHAMAATSINNTYFIDPAFNGATDWVVTFPMRKHAIYNGFYNDGTNFYNYKGVLAASVSTTPPTAPTTGKLLSSVEAKDVVFSQDKAFYDREEQQPAAASFSPVTGVNVELTREVNILSFAAANNATNKVLGSSKATTFTLDAGYTAGWSRLDVVNSAKYDLTVDNARWASWVLAPAATIAKVTIAAGTLAAIVTPASAIHIGVPMVGFAAVRGNTGDATKNVGETIPHSFDRSRGVAK